MRVLAVADRVDRRLEAPDAHERTGVVDLLLGAGDLPYSYLTFLADKFSCNCVFVAGNHDRPLTWDEFGEPVSAPRGWVYGANRVVEIGGVLVAGLSGSIAYNPGKPFQYSQNRMWEQALRLAVRIAWATRQRRRLDFLLTHSPAAGLNDGPDYAHQGFVALRWLLDRFEPRYFVHGHMHRYNPRLPTRSAYGKTEVINAFDFQIIDADVGAPHE